MENGIKKRAQIQEKMLSTLTRRFSSALPSNLSVSAQNVFEKSCYHKIDFKINENSPVQEAVVRFSAFNIGCLAVTNDANKVVGVFSQRDFITKIAGLKRDTDAVLIKDVCTRSPNIMVAKKTDSLDDLMNKMMFKGIRHLLVVDETDENFVGMISIRDIMMEINKKNRDMITRLSDFKIGKGAFFGSE